MNFLDNDFPEVTEAYRGSLEDWLELFERYAFPKMGDTETSTEMQRIFKRYTEVTYEDWLDIVIKCARDEIWYEEKINLSIRELYLVVRKYPRIEEKLKAIYKQNTKLYSDHFMYEAASEPVTDFSKGKYKKQKHFALKLYNLIQTVTTFNLKSGSKVPYLFELIKNAIANEAPLDLDISCTEFFSILNEELLSANGLDRTKITVFTEDEYLKYDSRPITKLTTETFKNEFMYILQKNDSTQQQYNIFYPITKEDQESYFKCFLQLLSEASIRKADDKDIADNVISENYYQLCTTNKNYAFAAELNGKSGIYEIINIKTRQKYYGLALNLGARLRQHARGRLHDSSALHDAIRKDPEAFYCRDVEIFNKNTPLYALTEQQWSNLRTHLRNAEEHYINQTSNVFDYNLDTAGSLGGNGKRIYDFAASCFQFLPIVALLCNNSTTNLSHNQMQSCHASSSPLFRNKGTLDKYDSVYIDSKDRSGVARKDSGQSLTDDTEARFITFLDELLKLDQASLAQLQIDWPDAYIDAFSLTEIREWADNIKSAKDNRTYLSEYCRFRVSALKDLIKNSQTHCLLGLLINDNTNLEDFLKLSDSEVNDYIEEVLITENPAELPYFVFIKADTGGKNTKQQRELLTGNFTAYQSKVFKLYDFERRALLNDGISAKNYFDILQTKSTVTKTSLMNRFYLLLNAAIDIYNKQNTNDNKAFVSPTEEVSLDSFDGLILNISTLNHLLHNFDYIRRMSNLNNDIISLPKFNGTDILLQICGKPK